MSNIQNIDWNVLLRGAKAGDRASRERLFSELLVRLRSVAQYRLRGWATEDLDDVVQNALYVVHVKLLEIPENPHHFALNVLRNKIGDALRARAGGRLVSIREERNEDDGFSSLPLPAPDPRLDEAIDRHELMRRIEQVVPRLSKFCQAFFTAALEGLSVGDVWDIALASEPALKRSAFDKRISDCRGRLRQLLAGGK
jgi:RNA polymerase sigma factor (sigma-70 family)